jgi:hypothetical protein
LTNLGCRGSLSLHPKNLGGTALTNERQLFTEAAWQDLAIRLARLTPQAGSPLPQRARLLLDAVGAVARTGMSGRALPRELGRWEAVPPVAAAAWPVAPPLFVDRPLVRAQQQAAGAGQATAATPLRL